MIRNIESASFARIGVLILEAADAVAKFVRDGVPCDAERDVRAAVAAAAPKPGSLSTTSTLSASGTHLLIASLIR